MCNSSALLNRNCENPFEIACGDGIFALLNHVLTVRAACARTWAELLQKCNNLSGEEWIASLRIRIFHILLLQ